MRQIFRVTHGYHRIVEKREISLAIDYKTGTINEYSGIKDIKNQDGNPKDEVSFLLQVDSD